MSGSNYKWFKVAEHPDEIGWSDSGLAEIQVNGKTVCVARLGETVFACAHKCPHAGGHMADGYIDALGNVVCPLHRYKFSLQNGRNVSGEGYYLKTYPVELREDGVYVGMESGGFLGFFR